MSSLVASHERLTVPCPWSAFGDDLPMVAFLTFILTQMIPNIGLGTGYGLCTKTVTPRSAVRQICRVLDDSNNEPHCQICVKFRVSIIIPDFTILEANTLSGQFGVAASFHHPSHPHYHRSSTESAAEGHIVAGIERCTTLGTAG